MEHEDEALENTPLIRRPAPMTVTVSPRPIDVSNLRNFISMAATPGQGDLALTSRPCRRVGRDRISILHFVSGSLVSRDHPLTRVLDCNLIVLLDDRLCVSGINDRLGYGHCEWRVVAMNVKAYV